MAAGNHHRAMRFQFHGGIVSYRSGHNAQIGDMAAGGNETFPERQVQAFTRQAAVPANVHQRPRPPLQISAQRAAQMLYALTRQVPFGDSADVVLAEDRGFQHIALRVTNERREAAPLALRKAERKKLSERRRR